MLIEWQICKSSCIEKAQDMSDMVIAGLHVMGTLQISHACEVASIYCGMSEDFFQAFEVIARRLPPNLPTILLICRSSMP